MSSAYLPYVPEGITGADDDDDDDDDDLHISV
jgi:hypothetical protein